MVRVGVAFAIGDLSEAGESQSIPLVNLARVLTGGVLTLLGARVWARRIETGKAIFRHWLGFARSSPRVLTTVELDVERWRDLDQGTGTATNPVTPRSLESGPET